MTSKKKTTIKLMEKQTKANLKRKQTILVINYGDSGIDIICPYETKRNKPFIFWNTKTNLIHSLVALYF